QEMDGTERAKEFRQLKSKMKEITPELDRKNKEFDSSLVLGDSLQYHLSCPRPKVEDGHERAVLHIPIKVKTAGNYRFKILLKSEKNSERKFKKDIKISLSPDASEVESQINFGDMWGLFQDQKCSSELTVT